MIRNVFLAALLAALACAGCARVPANAPQLSQRVSDGIGRLKHEHLRTLDKVYELSVSKVNDDYESLYAKAVAIFTANKGHPPGTPDEYLEVSIIAAGIRDLILKKLRENQAAVSGEIVKNYDLVASVNNEVTLYLHSAARLAQASSETVELMDKLTGVDLDIGKHLTELDAQAEGAVREVLNR